MKNSFLAPLILLLVMTTLCQSQERTSKSLAVIGEDIISELTTAEGWMLNADEQWQSLTNTIPVHLQTEDKALLKREKQGLGTDNFIYYQLKRLTYDSTEYIILIKKYRDGFYEYPTIEKSWNKHTSFIAYIFATSEWDKTKNVIDGDINLLKIELIDTIEIKWKSEKEALSLIPSKIDWNKPANKKPKLVLHIAPYKEKNIVQFQIYSIYGKYNVIGGIINEHKIKVNEKSYKTKQIYLTDKLFENYYYESDYEHFNTFITLE